MGCYDTICIFQKCPYCGEHSVLQAQTNDLGDRMFNYDSLPSNWKKHVLERNMRVNLPVFPIFPFDKGHKVWKNQAERTESSAKVPKEYNHLSFVKVIADCHSVRCQFDADRRDILSQGTPSGFGRTFYGKIAIIDGFLTGEIFDIEKDKLTETKLSRYKIKHKKQFDLLKKRYVHEPFICRRWFEGNREIEFLRENLTIKDEPGNKSCLLRKKDGKCNSDYFKNQKCNKKKCPYKTGGSMAMAVFDRKNWVR